MEFCSRRDQASLMAIVGGLLLSAPSDVASQSIPEAIQSARSIVERFRAEYDIPGISIAVAVHGEIVWEEEWGLADVEDGTPVGRGTRFRIGSVSKALTSAAVGLLYEEGRLDLDAPVQRYVPSFPEKEYPITTRQLGGHTSGIPHYGRGDFANFVRYESVVAALDKFKDRELLFVPGERYEYSSFGYNLISAVVEGAARVPFVEYMDSAVFAPLGMELTVVDDYRRIIPGRTDFYELTEAGDLRHAPFTDNSDVWAGGGYLSTSSDLVRFGVGMLNGTLLSPETTGMMFTPTATSSGEPSPYGLGWRVSMAPGGVRILGHGGSHFGARAQLVLVPEHGVVFAMLANVSSAPLPDARDAIVPLFFSSN